MPNHVTSIITVEGATIADVIAITKGNESDFDFNQLIPMPESVYNTVSTSHPDEAERMKQAENIEKYGYATWYEFSSNEWGTKWNAYDIDVSDDYIRFDTAWAMPDPIFMALSRKLPDATITVNYADEDIGYNCGVCIYKNGEVIGNTNLSGLGDTAKSFACRIKYGNEDEWKTWEED